MNKKTRKLTDNPFTSWNCFDFDMNFFSSISLATKNIWLLVSIHFWCSVIHFRIFIRKKIQLLVELFNIQYQPKILYIHNWLGYFYDYMFSSSYFSALLNLKLNPWNPLKLNTMNWWKAVEKIEDYHDYRGCW